MNILYSVKHWLQTKIYNAYINIEEERRKTAESNLLANFLEAGKKITIGDNSNFGGTKYISIGDNFQCGKDSWIYCLDRYRDQTFSPQLIFGNDVNIVNRCHIACIERIQIGNGTLIASDVFIGDHCHGELLESESQIIPLARPLTSKPIEIGENCWIGEHVSVLPGVTLGNNVIVGANAVVTHSFPSNVIIAGCPAKIIKKL